MKVWSLEEICWVFMFDRKGCLEKLMESQFHAEMVKNSRKRSWKEVREPPTPINSVMGVCQGLLSKSLLHICSSKQRSGLLHS